LSASNRFIAGIYSAPQASIFFPKISDTNTTIYSAGGEEWAIHWWYVHRLSVIM